MTKPKQPRTELLIDKRAVNKEMVFGLLRGGNVLSYRQMLEASGVPVRDIGKEMTLMDRARARQQAGEKVKFDRATSFRLRLIDILDKATRDKVILKAIRPKMERNGVCYFLASEMESLLASGAIIDVRRESDTHDAHLDFEVRMGILTSSWGRRRERLG